MSENVKFRRNPPVFDNHEEEITVNGYTGVLVNRNEIEQFEKTSRIPLSAYPINEDKCPLIVKKPCNGSHKVVKEVGVRFLQPKPMPTPGEIIIQEEVRSSTP